MRFVIGLALITAIAWLQSAAKDVAPKHCSADASDEIVLPESLQAPSTDGVLLLHVVIGEDGCTQDIRVAKGIQKRIDHAVADAVRSWRFEPAMRDGKPVKVLVELELKIVEKHGRLYLMQASPSRCSRHRLP